MSFEAGIASGDPTLLHTGDSAPRPNLRNIVDELCDLLAQIERDEGEVAPDIGARLDELNLTLEQKVDAYGQAARRMKLEATVSREMAKHYAQRAQMRDEQETRLKQRLQAEMERLGKPKLKGDTASATIQASNPSCELLVSDDEVPTIWVEMVPVVRKQALLAALKEGQTFSFARLQRGSHLRFR